jgi:dATP pyrophosphohydrolase
MARAPFQVLVFPYREMGEGDFEYAILRRADQGYWHVVSGGGEDDETPLEAARRETYEEIGLTPHATFFKLDTVSPVPVTAFRDSCLWGEGIYVIPQHCYGVQAGDHQILLSGEHTEVRWVAFEEACRLLRYDDNRVALWELDRRLQGLGPRD